MIRAVLFDLDRTLLDRDTSFLAFVASQHAKFFDALGPISQSEFTKRIIELDARGTVWKDKVYQTVVEQFSITGVTWQELFADFDSRIADYYVPFPYLHETIGILRKEGYALGLVTNGKGEFQRRTIRALGLNDAFASIVISEEAGLRKPDPEIFLKALRELDCEPAFAVYIGDNPDSDIAGARNAGMKTIWKREMGVASPDADAFIDDLAELPAVVARLE